MHIIKGVPLVYHNKESNMSALTERYCSIQTLILPVLEEEFGVFSAKAKEFASLLEFARPGRFLKPVAAMTGRPACSRRKILNAFFLKSVQNISTVKALLDVLRGDSCLRRLCGWDFAGEIPSEATFSRAFSEFSESGVLDVIHGAVVKFAYKGRLAGHQSMDSTQIENRERPVSSVSRSRQGPKEMKKRDRKSREEKAAMQAAKSAESRTARQMRRTLEENLSEQPVASSWGGKRNSKGVTAFWSGYKLHAGVADGGVPVAALLTSASLHDSQAAIPLMQKSAERVDSLYDLADSAYDAEDIRSFSRRLGHVAVIDANRRGGGETPEMDPAKRVRYNERTAVERFNADLKDNYGGRDIRVRGWKKVFCHLMFGVVAIAVKQLFNMQC